MVVSGYVTSKKKKHGTWHKFPMPHQALKYSCRVIHSFLALLPPLLPTAEWFNL